MAALIVLFYLIPFIVVLWLIKRFIDLANDVRYLANRARMQDGVEIPTTNPRVTIAVVVIAAIAIILAIVLSFAGSNGIRIFF